VTGCEVRSIIFQPEIHNSRQLLPAPHFHIVNISHISPGRHNSSSRNSGNQEYYPLPTGGVVMEPEY